jgi:hypothetical protein
MRIRAIQDIQRQAIKESANNTAPNVETSTPASTTDATANAPTTDTPAPAEQTKKKKWVMPVIIGGGVLVVGILAYVLLKRKK